MGSELFSILILTLNEEENLPRCLASIGWCDDVVVLDSGSTDRTASLASAAGARVVTRAFDNFAGQRNYAQDSVPFRHRWVFHLDADETFTPALRAECSEAAARSDLDGYYVAPKMIFQGRWIPHCTDYPAYQARFVRAPDFRFIQVGHGQREAPDMRMAYLRESYEHDLSSGGEPAWLAKHRRYAEEEARTHREPAKHFPAAQLWSRQPLERRRALKQLSYSLPFRPTLRFIYQYVLRRGFLDGAPGYRYCRLLATYERFAVEATRRARDQP